MGATLAAARPIGVARDFAGARVFRICLAAYIAVVVARIQEVIPGLTYLYLGKLAFAPMLVATLAAVPRWQLLAPFGTRPGKAIITIAVLALLSIPLSIWPANSANFFFFALIPQLVLFTVVSAGFTDRRTARLCIVTLVVVATVNALYVNSGLAPEIRGRYYIGSGLDPNESAAFFVCVLPFAMMLALDRSRTRALGLVAAPLFVAAIARSASRGGLVGLLVVGIVTMVQGIATRRWVLVIGIVVCGVAFVATASDTLSQRFQTMLEPETDYNVNDREGRLEVWKRGMGYMMSSPVLGVGIAGFETAEGTLGAKVNVGYGLKFTNAHNAFVQIGAELGVFGLIAFVTAFWSAAKGCRRVRRLASRYRYHDPLLAQRQTNLCSAILCALAAIASTGFFLSFAYHPLVLFILAAGAGTIAAAANGWSDPASTTTWIRGG